MTDHTFEKSSALATCSYNEDDKELTLTFTSGSTHIYEECPKSIFEGLKTAKSPGGYFHAAIKGQYKEKEKK